MREAIERQFRRQDAAEYRRRLMQGLGRPIISGIVSGYRVVAVGGRICWGKNWQTFHDFLFNYIRWAFGDDWARAQLALPAARRHPLFAWQEKIRHFQAAAQAGPEVRVQSARAIGAVSAYLGLAYDLYLAAHNADLPEILIKRLRQPDQFEGALYEAHVIGAFVSAGFSIAYEDEGDPHTTHCEFTATHSLTGRSFSVEAKSISSAAKGAGASTKPPKVLNRLRRALAKKAEHERIVFIELSRAHEPSVEIPLWTAQVDAELRRGEAEMVINDEPAPPAFIFVTNRSCVHALDSTDFADLTAAYGFKIPEFPATKPGQRLLETVRHRDKHIELYWLVKAIVEHSGVPSTFDDRTPAEAFNPSGSRLLIGNRYLVPDGSGKQRVGVLFDAVVDHGRKVAAGGYELEDGRKIICEVPLSDTEMEIYWESPNTFFGVVKSAGQRKLDSALDLYDFMFETYSKSTREKLLEFMAGWPDIATYRGLPQPELAQIYCALLAEQEAQRLSTRSRAARTPAHGGTGNPD